MAVLADESRPAAGGNSRWRSPQAALLAVAVLHALSPLVLLGIHWWFGPDETVYLSQINSHVPAGAFSAPRARGATLIAAPITLLTSSTAAVRVWVTALSGVGLYLAFRPWLKLRAGYVVPLAALIFSSIWAVIYYGFEVMPNEFVAFGALAACGYLLRYLDEGQRRHLVPIVASIAAIGLLRPSDAFYCGGAFVLCCLALRSPKRRRLIAGSAVAAGVVLGVAEWVIEAFVSYGGLLHRIDDAQAEQGGGGLHFAGAAQLHALAGPILCRGTCHITSGVVYQLWWFAAAGLLIVAVLVARRRRELSLIVVPVFVGLVMASQYIFTVTYAAPRFLIPTYALLSLPCAYAAIALVKSIRRTNPRIALRSVLVAALVVNAVIQVQVILDKIKPSDQRYTHDVFVAVHALRRLGVDKPCLVLGDPGYDQNLGYALDCTNVVASTATLRDDIADGHVVWIGSATPPAKYRAMWRLVTLRGITHGRRPAYVSVRLASADHAQDAHDAHHADHTVFVG
jgi:hypothetical protein